MAQATLKNIDHMLTRDMVDEYNRLTGKNITKFSSREAGVRQLTKAREAHQSGQAVLPGEEDEHDMPQDERVIEPVVEPVVELVVVKPARKESADRAKHIAESWDDPNVAAKRKQRNGVRVSTDGISYTEYNSVSAAFKALGLPMGVHIKFRMDLKACGAKTIKMGDGEYLFNLI